MADPEPPSISSDAGLGAFGRSQAERVGVTVTLGGLFALGFLPQLGGPGYDSALVAGVVTPSAAALTTAFAIASRRVSPLAAVVRGIRLGAVLGFGALAVAFLHGLRVGLCDAGEGALLLVLGPGFGAMLGGVSGAVAGLVAERVRSTWPRRAALVGLSLAGPLLGIVASLVRFYTSPMVFAYDPYFGYFSGPLYDTVIGSLWPLAAYRAGTVGALGFALAAAALAERDANGRVRFSLGGQLNVIACGAAGLGLSVLVTAFGTELGHFSTTASIERALGRQVSVGRCDVVYSSAVLARDAQRVGRECQAHLAQIEHFFETSGPERVRVFLFANDAEKGRQMGAARTYIAKPWRSEVYVQAAGFPHPVLGHELAHVVSRSFGRGPFRVAGLFAGLLPDPGRIEGVATAASPDENDALTLQEWAAAMDRLGLLPGLDGLFQLGFFGHNAARAYTAAGAFIQFLRTEYGSAAVRGWYAGTPLTTVTSQDLPTLERRFRAALAQVPLSEAALATARARFERPSFFERRCPRVIDRRQGEANGRLAAGDLLGAREGFRAVLALDPHDSGARLGLSACQARSGNLKEAAASYGALASAGDVAPWAKLLALEAQADVLLRKGQTQAAHEQYRELARELVDEDRLRTLDVKGLAGEGIAREAIVLLLIGDENGPSWDAAAPKLGEWSALTPADGLADYLLAKNLYNRGRYRDAGLYLDRALARSLPEPRVADEALRLRVVVACAELDPEAARWAVQKLRERNISPARRHSLDRLAERCGL